MQNNQPNLNVQNTFKELVNKDMNVQYSEKPINTRYHYTSRSHKNTCMQMFTAALFMFSKNWKPIKCLTEWINYRKFRYNGSYLAKGIHDSTSQELCYQMKSTEYIPHDSVKVKFKWGRVPSGTLCYGGKNWKSS